MNALTPNVRLSPEELRKTQAVGILERICEQLDPTETQRALAEQHYNAVGDWVAESELPIFRTASIYAQGSFALGTTNKPVGRDDIDVDLVAYFPSVNSAMDPAKLKVMLGDRLKAHGTYKDKLVEMPRCWRIDYANEFHLDITPSIPNRACPMGGELVPDKKLEIWKTSNPRGYRDLFAKRAAMQPRVRMKKSMTTDRARADVQPFPEQLRFKGVLRRIVQLAKRHRDVAFTLDAKVQVRPAEKSSDKAPDFRIFAGRAEIGAAWKKTSNEGRDYLSVKLDDPSLPAPILANLFEMEGGEFELIWSRPNGNRSRE